MTKLTKHIDEYDVLNDIKSKKYIIQFQTLEEKIYVFETCINAFLFKGEDKEAKIIQDEITKIYNTVPNSIESCVDYILKVGDIDCEVLPLFYEVNEHIVACYLFSAYHNILHDEWLFFKEKESPISKCFNFDDAKENLLLFRDIFLYDILLQVAKKIKEKNKKCRKKYKEEHHKDLIKKYVMDEKFIPNTLNDAVGKLMVMIDKMPNIKFALAYHEQVGVDIGVAYIFPQIKNIVFYYWKMYNKNNKLRKWFESEMNITNIEEMCYEVTKSFVSNVILNLSLK